MTRPTSAFRFLSLAAALAALATLATFTGSAAGSVVTVTSTSSRIFTIVDASNRALLGESEDDEDSTDSAAPALETGAGFLSADALAGEPELLRAFQAVGRTGVPEWAPRVRDALAEQGIPFSAELLASSEVNVSDAARPLFPLGAHPSSLFGLGVLEAGENAFLRSLSAEELMLQAWPLYYRYYHRAAGAAVPAGLEAGLTFGTSLRVACDAGTPGCIDGWTLQFSPVRSSDAYMRWLAYGFPGAGGDGQHDGYVVDDGLGWAYKPLTGEFFKVSDGSGSPYDAWRRMNLDRIMSGQILPEHFSTPWEDVVKFLVGSRIAAAGVLKDPSIWFAGQYEGYAPSDLEPETLDRYRALIAGD
jgi:hypothetical protein